MRQNHCITYTCDIYRKLMLGTFEERIDTLKSKLELLYFAKYFRAIKPRIRSSLDIGCGGGRYVRFLMDSRVDVLGIDINDVALQVADEFCPAGYFF